MAHDTPLGKMFKGLHSEDELLVALERYSVRVQKNNMKRLIAENVLYLQAALAVLVAIYANTMYLETSRLHGVQTEPTTSVQEGSLSRISMLRMRPSWTR